MAIAQRSSAQARHWRGLISDIFLGFTMRNVLKVLQKDVVNVWNMDDPRRWFLTLISVLVEDISEATINSVSVLFAEWVPGTYKKTKSSVRCLLIVDLTLAMDTLFYLVLSRGQTPIKIALVNSALRIYNGPKAPVHASIKAWVEWGTFGHLDADVIIEKIADIIMDTVEDGFDESWMPMEALREP
ncbi:hypothetical protein B0H14DRAFT_2959346 [Mycena olivaceomarginata]|nr:hypothetical protein B0H14DRAFT_2959346 [Mycena olivaceomarginata]